jgi:hypothetical protein
VLDVHDNMLIAVTYLCCHKPQVQSKVAADFLLELLGCKQQVQTPISSLAGIGSSSVSGWDVHSTGSTVALLPADTLQLVLDVLQQRLTPAHSSRKHSTTSTPTGVCGYQPLTPCKTNNVADGDSLAPHANRNEAVRHMPEEVTPLEESTVIQVHCWHLLTAVLQLAVKRQANHAGVQATRRT